METSGTQLKELAKLWQDCVCPRIDLLEAGTTTIQVNMVEIQKISDERELESGAGFFNCGQTPAIREDDC